MTGRRGKRGAIVVAIVGALIGVLLLATGATGAVDKSGNLVGSFDGAISPSRLPRSEPAPVAVRMGGKIKTTDRSTPPKLTQIVLEINSAGRIQNKGLMSCSLGKLKSLTTAAAQRACAGALIGHGNVTSRVSLPGQGAFASNGKLLAFNGSYNGRTAVLAHVESGPPLPLTYVIVFEVAKTHGTYGTKLIGTLPEIASEYGYISAFDLSLGRRYSYRGKSLSYASASCPAPKGFSKAPFSLARASYVFEDGRTLSGVIEGTCSVKG